MCGRLLTQACYFRSAVNLRLRLVLFLQHLRLITGLLAQGLFGL